MGAPGFVAGGLQAPCHAAGEPQALDGKAFFVLRVAAVGDVGFVALPTAVVVLLGAVDARAQARQVEGRLKDHPSQHHDTDPEPFIWTRARPTSGSSRFVPTAA
jgi:hypothetical protein